MFGTLLADPPWAFDDKKAGMVKTGKGAESHYPCMPLPKIKSFLEDTVFPGTSVPLTEYLDDNAHLWLWVPNAFVIEGIGAEVCRAWGFQPKTLITWCKGRIDEERKIVHHIGQGTYLRNDTEQLVFAVRGKCPALVHNLPTWDLAPRTEHSRKPDFIHEWAEKMSPGERMELFARRTRPGWTTLGNQVPAAAQCSVAP